MRLRRRPLLSEMLLNYMENSAVPIQNRWNTFGMYVQQGATADQQNLFVAGVTLVGRTPLKMPH